MVKNIEIIDVGSENNEAPKEVEEIKEEPIINEESKEVEPNNIINEEDNKVEEEPKQELKSKTYSTEKVENTLSNIVITVMEYQLKKNQTLTKLFEEKLCILHKQKNLRIMYMKKLKIIFQKWMNKK